MGKDKDTQGKIQIMQFIGNDDESYPFVAWRFTEAKGRPFKTAEDAKRWLRVNGDANGRYIIVQVKAEVKLEQQTITKLITTPPSVE